jgi:hypothetical protein
LRAHFVLFPWPWPWAKKIKIIQKDLSSFFGSGAREKEEARHTLQHQFGVCDLKR